MDEPKEGESLVPRETITTEMMVDVSRLAEALQPFMTKAAAELMQKYHDNKNVVATILLSAILDFDAYALALTSDLIAFDQDNTPDFLKSAVENIPERVREYRALAKALRNVGQVSPRQPGSH